MEYDGERLRRPTARRGIDPGWADLYDRRDPGQAIDITGLPDGVYWFQASVDPGNNFVEADKTNNTTVDQGADHRRHREAGQPARCRRDRS